MNEKYAIQHFRNGKWEYVTHNGTVRTYSIIERPKAIINKWIHDGYHGKLRITKYASNS